MTATAGLPSFVSREEGDGFVLYMPDTSRYLYANALAHEVLSSLRSAGSADAADELSAEMVDVLSSRRERTGEPGGDSPCLCPLSDVVGDSADRCETFGMPL